MSKRARFANHPTGTASDVRGDDVESMREYLPKDGLVFSSEHTACMYLKVCMTSRLIALSDDGGLGLAEMMPNR